MELVNSRNQAFHLENYEDKWNNLRELVNKVLDDFQSLYVQAQDQDLRNWFNEVAKSMKVVEVKRSIKQLSDSPHFIDPTKKIPTTINAGLDTSWITSMFIKPKRIVMKSLNLEDHEEMKLVEKLQEDMFK